MHELLNYPSETDLEEYPEEKTDWAGSILDDDYSTLPQPTWEDGYTKRVSLNACRANLQASNNSFIRGIVQTLKGTKNDFER